MEIVKLGFRHSRVTAEEGAETLRVHSTSSAKIEELKIQFEITTGRQVSKLMHLIDKPALSIGRQSHDLVLAIVDGKAEIRSNGAVKEAQRVGKLIP